MKPGGRSRRIRLLAGAAGACLATGTALLAQDGGRQGLLTFGLGVSGETNPGLSTDGGTAEMMSFANVGLNLNTSTRSQSASFSFQGGVEGQGFDGFDFTDPFVQFGYQRQGRQSQFTTNVRLRTSDLSSLFLAPIEGAEVDGEGFLPVQILASEGQRTVTSGGISLTTGVGGPVSTAIDLSFSRRDFTDTTDPDFYDDLTQRTSADVTLAVSPVMDLTFGGATRQYDADNAEETNRLSRNLNAGVSLEASDTLTVTARVSGNRVETTTTGGTTVQEGAGFSLSAAQARPTGALDWSLSSLVSAAGRETELQFAQTIERPVQTFSYGIGVSRTADLDLQPVVTVGLEQQTQTGVFVLTASYQTQIDNEGNPLQIGRLNTSYETALSRTTTVSGTLRLSDVDSLDGAGADTQAAALLLDFTQDLSPVASWSAGLDLSLFSDDDGTERRADLDLGFSRALTRDWSLDAGLGQTLVQNETGDRAGSTEISLGLGREVAFRP